MRQQLAAVLVPTQANHDCRGARPSSSRCAPCSSCPCWGPILAGSRSCRPAEKEGEGRRDLRRLRCPAAAASGGGESRALLRCWRAAALPRRHAPVRPRAWTWRGAPAGGQLEARRLDRGLRGAGGSYNAVGEALEACGAAQSAAQGPWRSPEGRRRRRQTLRWRRRRRHLTPVLPHSPAALLIMSALSTATLYKGKGGDALAASELWASGPVLVVVLRRPGCRECSLRALGRVCMALSVCSAGAAQGAASVWPPPVPPPPPLVRRCA